MAKKSTRIITLIIAVALCVAVLAGCSTKFVPVPGDVATADTTSNNGIVVKHGEYYYFINGLESYDKLSDIKYNKFGTPLKGSICRVKKGAEGYEDFNVIVPKVNLTKNKEVTFSIFGGFIYYASPSVTTDTKGVVQVGYTDFFRCKLDGSGTQSLGTIEGDSIKYKFTDKGMTYVEGTTLKSIAYNDSTISAPKTIAENVTSSAFPVSGDYKIGQETAQDFVFYTIASENEEVAANEVYAVNGDASKKIKLMDSKSYTTEDTDKKNQFAITLSMAKVEANGDVALYYNKGGEYAVEGLFGYKYGAADLVDTFAFNKANEKQFSNRGEVTAMPISFEKGVAIVDTAGGKLYIPKIVDGIDVASERIEWVFPKGAALTVTDIVVGENQMYLLHNASGRLERLDMRINGRDKNNAEDSGFLGNSIPVLAKGLSTDWQTYEILDGEIFFFNSTYMGYVFTANLGELEGLNEKGLTAKFVGKMTEADKKTYDKQLEDEKKAEEENK